MQNAADATAISGATWIARGLNVISMNNVTQTQVLAMVLIIRALDEALPYAIEVLQIQRAACAALLIGAAVCAGIITAQIVILQGIQTAVSSVGRPLARARGVLWNAMLALELVSDAVRNSFVVMAEAEADRIARQDGADLGFIVPAGLRITLPVRKGAMRSDLCQPTRRGSPSHDSRGYTPLLGYDLNEGPFERYSRRLGYGFVIVENSLIRLFFNLTRESHYRSLCGGDAGGSSQPQERRVASLTQCRLAVGGTATWAITQSRTVLFNAPQPGIGRLGERNLPLDGDPRAVDPPEDRSCDWTPPGQSMGSGRYRLVREIVETADVDANGNPIRRYRYEFTEYLFLSARVPVRTPQRPSIPLPSGRPSSENPDPYLLEADATDDLRYLAVTYRSRDDRAAPRYFTSAFGTHRLAYAQARVYNPTAFDTFTQDWRVTLEPASLIEDGTLLNALASPALNLSGVRNARAVAGLRESVGGLSELGRSLNLLQYLNNH
jgi:hypothetical protein